MVLSSGFRSVLIYYEKVDRAAAQKSSPPLDRMKWSG
jgi:hypothetical protein